MRLFCTLSVLAASVLLLVPSVCAQWCPLVSCQNNWQCRQQVIPATKPPCWECVCVFASPGADTGVCMPEEAPESTKCDTDGTICTVEHCDDDGNCELLGNALQCIPCDTDNNDCTVETCDGNGKCVRTGSALPGTLCHPNGSECMAGSCNSQTEPPSCGPIGPLPVSTPCGNTCTDHCDGQGNCVLVNASLRWCPEGMPCDNKDCATTKYEKCQLLELQEPERFWYFCQCRGQLIDCCEDTDCPGSGANPCIKCIMPLGDPGEVGGNCGCAVGDSCLIGGFCQAEGQGQCAEPGPGQCICQ